MRFCFSPRQLRHYGPGDLTWTRLRAAGFTWRLLQQKRAVLAARATALKKHDAQASHLQSHTRPRASRCQWYLRSSAGPHPVSDRGLWVVRTVDQYKILRLPTTESQAQLPQAAARDLAVPRKHMRWIAASCSLRLRLLHCWLDACLHGTHSGTCAGPVLELPGVQTLAHARCATEVGREPPAAS